MIGEYSCGCVQGFESYDCSGEINECLSNPSDPTNTIYLEDLTNSFRCFCNRGHTGKTSAISVTFCVAGLCQCGSYYKDVPGGFRCHCLHGKIIPRLKWMNVSVILVRTVTFTLIFSTPSTMFVLMELKIIAD
ncbi:protein eyes shut homolog isoform X2 [Chiloscyllium plagiosum]|uniref:protein eyes shut homolog isoform X2 n=1 Tax=Chiloscyllium plagiosum TaxID=36176 RepID=UPI001CB7E3EF|nr:protein eyes shut homolog isoform X2 [Chiloscyllium plagiosum]